LEFQFGQLTTLGLQQITYIRFRNVEFSRVQKIAKSNDWLRHVSLSVFLSFCMEQLGSHCTDIQVIFILAFFYNMSSKFKLYINPTRVRFILHAYIQGVTGGTDQTSAGCSLC